MDISTLPIDENTISVLLVVLSLALKCFFRPKPEKPIWIVCILELPTDIISLSLGYTASQVIAKSTAYQSAFFMFVIEIIFAMPIYYLCKTSGDMYEKLYEAKKNGNQLHIKQVFVLGLVSIVSYAISTLIYISAIFSFAGKL
jgi:hypothetical protein